MYLFISYCTALSCRRVHLSHFLRCFAPTEIRGVVVGTRALSWRLCPIAQEMSGHPPPHCEATVEAVSSHAEKVFWAYFLSFCSFLRAYFLMGVPFFCHLQSSCCSEDKTDLFTNTNLLLCVMRQWDFGSGSHVASSQLASKSFRPRSDRTAGWWLVHCFPTLCHLLCGSVPVCFPLLHLRPFFPPLFWPSACFLLLLLQLAVPPGRPVGVHCGWIPPHVALGRDGQQRTQGHLPYYNPLLTRPSVRSRLEKIWKDARKKKKKKVISISRFSPFLAHHPSTSNLCLHRWSLPGLGGSAYPLYGVLCDAGRLCCGAQWWTAGLHHATEQHYHSRRKKTLRHTLIGHVYLGAEAGAASRWNGIFIAAAVFFAKLADHHIIIMYLSIGCTT